ncbi:Gti1/Pac2 family-domain-containing protein [Obelidium mucronatum]|nr:Gti1/Pac2 family-domain-containing protein [Obelidium mucronatum]
MNSPAFQSHGSSSAGRPPATFHGHIRTELDAKVLIEACIAGEMAVLNTSKVPPRVTITSGTCVVFQEGVSNGMLQRWRDGLLWSSSRIQGSFLLYREVKPVDDIKSPIPKHAKEPSSSPFSNTIVRGNYKHVPNGFAKRTITLEGSNGKKYRVICYFYPKHVAHLYEGLAPSDGNADVLLTCPSETPQFAKFLPPPPHVPLEPPQQQQPQPQPQEQEPQSNQQFGLPFGDNGFEDQDWQGSSSLQTGGSYPYPPMNYTQSEYPPHPVFNHQQPWESASYHRQDSQMQQQPYYEHQAYYYTPYYSGMRMECPCGGLGSKKHTDAGWDVGWENSGVILPPIKRQTQT